MLTNLHKKIQELDQKRCTLLDEIESLDVEKLEAKPLPNKWSILEIIEHLVIAEKDVFQGFPKMSQLIERKRNFKTHFTYPKICPVRDLNPSAIESVRIR